MRQLSPYEVLRQVRGLAEGLATSPDAGTRGSAENMLMLLQAVNPRWRLLTEASAEFRTQAAATADMKDQVRKMRQGGRTVLTSRVLHTPGTERPYRWHAWVVQP